MTEHNLTYLACSHFILGYNLILDPLAKNLDKYDFGFNWAPAEGASVGFKHESTNKLNLELGKFFLFFHHAAS